MIDPSARALQVQAAQGVLEHFITKRLDQLLEGVDFSNTLTLIPVFKEAYLMGMADGGTELGELIWER
jgi:hypothetical protein